MLEAVSKVLASIRDQQRTRRRPVIVLGDSIEDVWVERDGSSTTTAGGGGAVAEMLSVFYPVRNLCQPHCRKQRHSDGRVFDLTPTERAAARWPWPEITHDDCVVVVDYQKGAVTSELLRYATDRAAVVYVECHRRSVVNSIFELNAVFKGNAETKGALDWVTLGADGCKHVPTDSVYRGIAREEVCTLGAGDQWLAGYIAALMHSHTRAESAHFANYVAGIQVTKPRIEPVTLAMVKDQYNADHLAQECGTAGGK